MQNAHVETCRGNSLARCCLVAISVLVAWHPARARAQAVPATFDAVLAQPSEVLPLPAEDSPSSTSAAIPEALADFVRQSTDQAAAKSVGCITCHETVGDPHVSPSVHLGCCDCHGGNPTALDMHRAHVHPAHPEAWLTAANPVRSYTLLNQERPEFIRFVNPADLRVAQLTCGQCHSDETHQVSKSMMTHGCMLWGAALYNNGAVPFKQPRFGESYSMYGAPQRLQTAPPPTPYEIECKGIVPYLDPLPRFQITQPGNVLRTFERGGRFVIESGLPETKEEPGRPRARLSNRGLGTLNRTDPVFIGLQKTRLLDPTLNFLGTNDHPGDYRSSGCTACHMVYANDRSPVNSGPFAKYGHLGQAAAEKDSWIVSVDPTIRKDEPGHPIQHRFTRAIPSSQCIVCHIHPGTTVMNTYLGFMWWDLETDGELMYPEEERKLTAEQANQAQMSDPNEASARGNWSDPGFLASVAELNPYLRHTQFADFHGHGWVFRAVFKKDRKGHLLDHQNRPIGEPTNEQLQASIAVPEYVKQLYRNRDWDATDEPTLAEVRRKEEELQAMRDNVPVHLLDVHLERGMHCVDCHFVQDVHGNGALYGEVRAAIEITCQDCHGDESKRAVTYVDGRPEMFTTGPAAEGVLGSNRRGLNLLALRTPSGKRRFEIHGDRLIQNSLVEKELSWEITQVADTINPQSAKFNALSALAKTVRMDEHGNFAWGNVPAEGNCAHSAEKMSCIACHSSWNASCYGCHLPQRANEKMPDLHNEGDVTRNYVAYNFQTLRDEVYMLARDGDVTGNRIGPSRSSCAVHVGSYNQNRESIYVQQQTISSEGPSGIAFSTNVPHTVRGANETKNCSDCHVAATNDNNALMAQLLMQGTNYLNFIGRYAWVAAGEHGLFAVEATERAEPQAVIGSTLHEMAFPEHYEEHVERGRELEEAHEHPGKDIAEQLLPGGRRIDIHDLQLRGEFLYAACGEGGLRVFDVAFVDHKGFSERIVTAPVSPAGQQLYVRSANAVSVAAPSTTAPDPTRTHRPENKEPEIHPLYAYLYVADTEEGLILVGAGTLLDGNPTNNYLERALTFNPDGLLRGARRVTIAGTFAYVCCDAGLVVLSIDDPLCPQVCTVIGPDVLNCPTDVQIQFRYAFICDHDGVKVFDVTDLSCPQYRTTLPLEEAHRIYVARTYAYIAAGHQGLVILDVTNPEAPCIDQIFTADGELCDVRDVKLGITYVSEFAYVADGPGGLRIIQLTSPETPGNDGFSPRPTPRLVATYRIPKDGHALAVSEGVDRDRAVDETGNQISVFGRIGARPLNAEEQRRMYCHPALGLWRVIDGVRNYSITDAMARETDLIDQLRTWYGTPNMPSAASLDALSPIETATLPD
jgi:hypothetical protein